MTEHDIKVLWSALHRINADNMASCPCKACRSALEEGRQVFDDLLRLVRRHQGVHNKIRERAYVLWEEAGRPEGDGVEFWLRAEREMPAERASASIPERRVAPQQFHDVLREHRVDEPLFNKPMSSVPKSNKSMMAEMQAAESYRATKERT